MFLNITLRIDFTHFKKIIKKKKKKKREKKKKSFLLITSSYMTLAEWATPKVSDKREKNPLQSDVNFIMLSFFSFSTLKKKQTKKLANQ